MALSAGTRLGPYEVVAALESGGMGEVYRARDTRLDRAVAIKVVATELAADPQLRERFEREARAIAALNHPNICTLHDVGHEGDVAFLVMELLEGETLASRLERGPIPLDRAVEYAIQIASALDRAHRAGIVHRDLKPGNIMLTKSGAKLLDFGLAKRAEPVVSTGALSLLPTTPPNLTAQGAILGTFQYMAPEQLEGAEADARTDIFAFGTVAYEMVTGRKAFEGKSQVGLIGAILEREPTPASTLQPSCPAALDRVLQRCLAKDPDERWQSAGDLSAQLKWIADKETSTASGTSAVAGTSAQKSNRLWMAAAALLSLVAAGGSVAAFYFYRTGGTQPVLRFTVPAPDNGLFDASQIGFIPAVSPDGTRLAFTARDAVGVIQVWIRQLDTLSARPLQGTEGAAFPFWSPDGRSIGFFSQNKLKRIDIAGGPPLTLCDAVAGRGGAWSPDGVILFAPSGTGSLFRVAAGGGDPVAVTKPADGQSGHRFPSFLPDGRHFLYVGSRSTGGSDGIFSGSLETAESTRVVAADSHAVYSPSGELLFIRDGTLLRQPFDATTRTVSGDPTPVAEQVAVGNSLGAFSISQNGVLAYRAGSGTSGNVQLSWFDRTGKLIQNVGGPGPFRGVDLSPDGRRIALHRHEGNGGDLWLFDLARRGTLSRFTFEATQDNAAPIWSPDGSRIAYGSLRDGKWGVYAKAADGTGREELFVESELPKMPMSWSPDGRFLIYWLIDPKTGADQWVLPTSGDKKPSPLLQTSFGESHPQVSPNGRWMSYHSNETGRPEIYVRSFPSGDGKFQISSGGGSFARWRADGKELFYLSSASFGKLLSVTVNATDTGFQYGDPAELFESGYINFTHGLNYHTFAVSPDGQRFLIPRPEGMADGSQPAPITVVINWMNAATR
jgi:Tol biopolymer transport system component